MELINWLTNEYNEGRIKMSGSEFKQLIETLIDLNNTRTYMQSDIEFINNILNGGK